MIVLFVGKQVEYNTLAIDEKVYYYCTDTKAFYKGSTKRIQEVRIVTARSTTPSQSVWYLVDGDIEIFEDGGFRKIGTAYRLGTDELYTTRLAVDMATSIYSAPAEEHYDFRSKVINVETAKKNLNNSLTNGYFDNVVETSSIQPTSEDLTNLLPIDMTINAISNLKSWYLVDNQVVSSIEEMNTIENPSDGMTIELHDSCSDQSDIYVYQNGSWTYVGSNVNLASYYENVEYVATPLSLNKMSVSNTTMIASIAEEEINAIDYIEFAETSGAASNGVVGSPSISDYNTETATVAFVATSIATATQRLQVYVDELTDLFDPLGSADMALERAVRYVDERLTWHNTGEDELIVEG